MNVIIDFDLLQARILLKSDTFVHVGMEILISLLFCDRNYYCSVASKTRYLL